MSLREELEARFRDLENQQNNQNITPIPPTQPAMPQPVQNYPTMLPKQVQPECSLKSWNDKYKELKYMDNEPNSITTGSTTADKILENLLWKLINLPMATPQGQWYSKIGKELYSHTEPLGRNIARHVASFNEVCNTKK